MDWNIVMVRVRVRVCHTLMSGVIVSLGLPFVLGLG